MAFTLPASESEPEAPGDVTSMLTVARFEPCCESLAAYSKLSVPTKPVSAVYVNEPSAFIVTVPFAGVVTLGSSTLNVSPSASPSFASTPPAASMLSTTSDGV